jgi:hypothetical protein
MNLLQRLRLCHAQKSVLALPNPCRLCLVLSIRPLRPRAQSFPPLSHAWPIPNPRLGPRKLTTKAPNRPRLFVLHHPRIQQVGNSRLQKSCCSVAGAREAESSGFGPLLSTQGRDCVYLPNAL